MFSKAVFVFIAVYAGATVLHKMEQTPAQTAEPRPSIHSARTVSEVLEPSAAEQLSYDCGKNVATLVDPSVQQGPLFVQAGLIFTSLEASDTSRILLVNAGAGDFQLPLPGSGVNRLRFTIPAAGPVATRTFYLSYLHGGIMPSRYFEFAEGHVPAGHDESDYHTAEPRRAPELDQHLNYAIERTVHATVSSLLDGRLTRAGVTPQPIEACRALLKQAPTLASSLRHDLDSLALLALDTRPLASARMPASVPNSQMTGKL